MQDIRRSIKLLEDETSECDLLAVLAADEATRKSNRARADMNRKLLAQARHMVGGKGGSSEKDTKSQIVGGDLKADGSRSGSAR